MDVESITALYQETCGLLVNVAKQQFRIPHCDAECLMQDVFLSFLRHQDRIEHPKKWLVGAICNASRKYWYKQDRKEEIADAILRDYDTLVESTAATSAEVALTLEKLDERCRAVLEMKYLEGMTSFEMAKQLDTTPAYARKIVGKCVRRAIDTVGGDEQSH